VSVNAEPQQTHDDHEDDATRKAIVAAARSEIIRYGLRRANMEKIAARAGVSRVTVYRRFRTKAELLAAVVNDFISTYLESFDDLWQRPLSPAEKVEAAAVFSIEEIRTNPLLRSLIESDPDAMLRFMTLDGEVASTRWRTWLAIRLSKILPEHAVSAVEISRRAEVVHRLFVSFYLQPYGLLPGRTPDDVRAFAREFLMPIIFGDIASV
jgi:AcrR family transcriptional regulator